MAPNDVTVHASPSFKCAPDGGRVDVDGSTFIDTIPQKKVVSEVRRTECERGAGFGFGFSGNDDGRFRRRDLGFPLAGRIPANPGTHVESPSGPFGEQGLSGWPLK